MAASTPWAATTDKVLKAHKVSQDEGLSDDQVSTLREKYGPNELDKEEGTPLWQLVLDQFDDLLVKILLGAACAGVDGRISNIYGDPPASLPSDAKARHGQFEPH